MDLGAFLEKNWATISSAPIPFIVAVLAAAGLVWYIATTHYAGQMSTLQAQIVLAKEQRDDYKNKLNGATPDEAKARLDRLESAVAGLSPRNLKPDQVAAIKQTINAARGKIQLTHDMSCADCNAFANRFRTIFGEMGWNVRSSAVLAPGLSPISGVGVGVLDPSRLSEIESVVIRSLKASNIQFDIVPRQQQPTGIPELNSDVSILFTTAQ